MNCYEYIKYKASELSLSENQAIDYLQKNCRPRTMLEIGTYIDHNAEPLAGYCTWFKNEMNETYNPENPRHLHHMQSQWLANELEQGDLYAITPFMFVFYDDVIDCLSNLKSGVA